jgi:Protein of unknown function (DUF2442)
MTTLTAHKRTARYENGFVFVDIDGIVEIKFGIAANHRLSKGNESQLRNIEVSPFGLHWPDLDEDLSFKGLVDGNCGSPS